MFIELHLKSDQSAIIIGLHQIIKIKVSAEGVTAIDLAHGGGTILVSEPYADVRRTLEPR
jgi:hypothetical protein